MKPKSRKVEKLSRVLTEPVVRFVSLVSHAATQTPFKFLKAAQIVPVENETQLGIIDATDVTRPVDGDDIMLQKMSFPADKYDMIQASDFAKDLGFEDFTTERDGDVVIVKSTHFEQFNDDVATIKSDNGILMFVGTLKGEDAGEVELQAEESQKQVKPIPHLKGVDAEVLQKYDPYVSWWSSETDLGDMINEGMYDGLPIGAPEISNAYWSVVANAARDGDMGAIRKASNDMGNLIVALWDLYSGLASSDNLEILSMSKEAQERLLKNEDGSEAAAEQAANDQAVEKPADGVEAEKQGSEAVNAEEKKEEDAVVGKEPEAPEQKSAELTREEFDAIIKSAIAPYVEAQEKMSKTIEAQEKQIKSLEGSAIQRRGVETNEEEGTRESSEDVKQEAARKQVAQAQAEKSLRNALGI